MQAQEFAPAKWSIAQRMMNGTHADIERTFSEGRLLRTHVLRPTWHFILRDDIRWVLRATAPGVQAFNAPYYRQTDLSAAALSRANRLIVRWLEGGAQLTRAEVSARLAKERIAAEGLRLACIMMNAELEGIVCSGARRGKQHTYALLDDRAPGGATAATRETALARLAVRFFEGHGPATVRDFRWWATLKAREAAAAIEAAGSKLREVRAGARTYWMSASEEVPSRRASNWVRLLQGYDEYVVAFSETKDVFGGARLAGPRRTDGAQFLHAIVAGTEVIGHWRPVARGTRACGVEWYANRPLTPSENASLRGEIARYETFFASASQDVP